ncbi:hypothetical protein DFJ43DRAFT_1041771 [Lentinula guzmanii]|uniref:Uncharacterized protein n=1 Tax=Lentinula guzmanii TaxID=2804957 RepID=A0AA38JI15_9AGAR|nr:hypothetical protein DFJ43DRAFT_1041771 [Lentinula guzmanii]
MSYHNLWSRCTQSVPAVPGTLNTSPRIDESEPNPDLPLTPIESKGQSRAPSPKGQGYKSALSEPDETESVGPSERNSLPRPSETVGGRVAHTWTDEPTKNMKSVTTETEQESSLSSEQGLTIQMAEANLSPEQHGLVQLRQNTIRILDADDESQAEGPSSGKGKELDPLNWGNITLNNDERNPDVQN